MWLTSFMLAVLFLFGWIEKRRHNKNIEQLPLRININGIRGKSTVTRLITGIFIEHGTKVVGKTTGTAARLLYWNREEQPIHRRIEGPNIREQMKVISHAVKMGAECVVCECMAVNPDYQITFQEEMLRANIGVILNVLEDHLDVMGPTKDEVAEALASTIPYGGHLVLASGPYDEFFRREATKRKTQVHMADASFVEEDYVKQFPYMVFPDNIAVALTVSQICGIDANVAIRGMLHANPDPGATRILPIHNQVTSFYFVNGFAANDPSSTLHIWNVLKKQGYPTHRTTVIMNAREDRFERTIQFANEVLPFMIIDTLLLMGQAVSPIWNAYKEGKLQAKKMVNVENQSLRDILDKIDLTSSNQLIFGIGNIHGQGEAVCQFFESLHDNTHQPIDLYHDKVKSG